jgi:hypothetical protein
MVNIILKWILEKYDGSARIGFICLRKAMVAGSCEHGDEAPGSMNVW